jgi:DNA-binding XRE family transcriptional regulator
MSGWEYESEEQKTKMEEKVTVENCGEKLRLIRDVSGISRRELAEVLGCSEATISRIETKKTFATNDFINKLRGLSTVGYYKFSKMTEAEKGVIGEAVGSAGGVATGVGASIAAVSAAGSVGGLSAAGITSGLAAIGGGTMLGGIATVAAIPVAVGLAGWGLVKGIKAICTANNLSCEEINEHYEIVSGSSIANKDEES